MKRLTKRNDTGQAYYPVCFEKPCEGDGCMVDECPEEGKRCEALAAYEDTGLTPEQIRSMDKEYLNMCEEVNKLKERIRKYEN